MRKMVLLLAALGLSVFLAAQTQDRNQQSTGNTTNTQASSNQRTGNQGQANGGQHMSGKVSSDGKTFTSDSNQKYQVDNPSSLQNVEGQQVDVLVAVDPDTGTIHIIQVAAPQQ